MLSCDEAMRDGLPNKGASMALPTNAMSQATFQEMYERWLVPSLFQPWAEMTLDEVRLSAGDRVLDKRVEQGSSDALPASGSERQATSSASM